MKRISCHVLKNISYLAKRKVMMNLPYWDSFIPTKKASFFLHLKAVLDMISLI